MKKIVLFLSILFASALFCNSVYAQGKYGADSAECIKYLSYYTEYYKQKNYESALPNWRKAYAICPATSRYSLLTDGTTLLRRQITKSTTSAEYKKELIDSLMTIYKQRVELWPKYKTASLNNMALDMYNYMKDDQVALYEGLSRVIQENGSATKANIFVFHFNSACDLYQAGNLTAEDVMNAYQQDIELLSQVPTKNDIEKKLVEKSVSDLENLLIQSQVANCDNLIALFTPRYEAAPEDLTLAKNIVRMLQITEGCVDNDLYLNAVNTIYRMEPSHNSAYYLFRLYASRRDIDNAIKFIEEALAYEDCDNETKAKYFFELAKTCSDNNRNSKAYDAAYKALEFSDVYDGKAYMLIAELWASAPCSGEISGRAKFWVATDFMVKAKNADPELTSVADNAIGRYRAYFPKTDVAFMYDLTNGQGYTLSCGGMRASTTVRTNR